METMDTMNWAEIQNGFCDECFSMPLPNEDWERTTEHKASYALETNLKQSQDLRYCCVYKDIFINSKNKKYIQEFINYKAVKGIMSCLVSLKEEDYADVLSIITSFYNRYRKKTVVVIPPLFRQRQWNKFKEYHLSYFLTELGKRNIPFCETLDAGMLKKQGKYVIVFSVATTKELLETVLHDYLTVGDHKNNGFMSLSFFYGEHHQCLKNVYPVG